MGGRVGGEGVVGLGGVGRGRGWGLKLFLYNFYSVIRFRLQVF